MQTPATPITSPTATQIPTLEPTITPPTLTVATPTSVPTEEAITFRVSPIDGMPQVYIPVGTFRMGGLDIRHAPDEAPAHDVTIDAFWMDQLEVTNAMYQLCVKAGQCTPPQNFGSQRRSDYYQNIEFKDYPVVFVTRGPAKNEFELARRPRPPPA
ncbi:MAG: SUMF1/EgtB/PvdO family nonheme iron enzyme, partial [Anaerolineales bacterium]|nr:SUMF1/EgtB/PvdO family nonheme iron enzyme [Anaerolineales bacterium]